MEWETIDRALGLSVDAQQLGAGQMCLRAAVVFAVAVLVARFADRRLLGRIAGYDFMVGVILGSVLSRAINGQAAFFPTLAASIVLVVLHHAVGVLALRSHRFSHWVKGSDRMLIRDGVVDADEMRRNKITEHDLAENLRLRGAVREPGEVAEARLERNGHISVIGRKNG